MQRYLISLCILLICDGAFAKPTINDTVESLLQVCLGKTTYEKLEAEGKGEVVATLKLLANVHVNADVGTSFTREEWVGMQGGLSSGLSEVQADQANAVRACLRPYMDRIVEAILNANE